MAAGNGMSATSWSTEYLPLSQTSCMPLGTGIFNILQYTDSTVW